MAKRKTRAQIENEWFRATAASLLHVRHKDWTEWEFEWLLKESRRSPEYIYSDKEVAKLKQLVGFSKTVTHFAGRSIQDLLKMAYPWRFDLDEDGEEFLEKLHRWGATDLKIRQARRLALICRQFEKLDDAA